MDQKLDLVGIGSMVVDLIYRVPRIISSEEKVILTAHDGRDIVRKLVGGVTLNHLAWAGLLGLRVGIFGKQGEDELGRFLRAGMDLYEIDKHLTLDGNSSSFAHIFVDPQGSRAIYMSPAATGETTADYVRERHADYIRSSKFLSTEVSQLPLNAVVAALQIAREGGVTTVLDVDVLRSDAIKTLGTRDEFDTALSLADYIKPSKAAAAEITGKIDSLDATRQLRKEFGARAVVITDGALGSAASAHEFEGRLPAYQITPVDSTGAGDAFLGGMIAGIQYGLDWTDILKLANACGGACCEITGATPNLEKSLARVFELYDGTQFTLREKPARTATSSSEDPYDNAVEGFLRTAIDELNKLRSRLGEGYFQEAIKLITNAEKLGGRVHFTGVGKPQYVAGYVSALFSSTGTPAYFLDGTECVHGSAGQVARGDVVVVISNSGETAEMRASVTALKRNGALILGVSGNPQSWLARESNAFLAVGVTNEGSPLGFEPRASVLAQLYVLAALSIELQARKRITHSDYNAWHPGGLIGKYTSGDR